MILSMSTYLVHGYLDPFIVVLLAVAAILLYLYAIPTIETCYLCNRVLLFVRRFWVDIPFGEGGRGSPR